MLAATKWAFVVATGLGVVAIASGCRGGAAIGERCESGGCAADLQCLGGFCAPLCERDAQCGDGFTCEEGRCAEVVSSIGDSCRREIDCGPGQTCELENADPDGDGWLAASCQREEIGAVTGSECLSDAACRSGSCNFGRCTPVCQQSGECPEGLVCTEIPRLLAGGSAMFRGCLPSSGVLTTELDVPFSHAQVPLPMPGNAVSAAITVSSRDPSLYAGAFRLEAPGGEVLYRHPRSSAELMANPIRYQLERGESTLLFPNRPELAVEPGVYQVWLGTALAPELPATDIPSATVHYKLDRSAVLDLHVHFLHLESHPCRDGIGTSRLSASSAPALGDFQRYVTGIGEILGQAGIELGEVTYRDLADVPELDILRESDLGAMLSLAETRTGINLFLVRSIEPGGLLVLAGGTPGAPRMIGSRSGGVAISMDTLCYRSWPMMSRITAHAVARQMGLFRNRDPASGIEDPIEDSSDGPENLMFFSSLGGAELSPGQSEVLRLYPGLR
jgi:hypothetical protein